MARKKRKVPGINGSSCADISFMLLLFFLLTTSMDTDTGLPRRLPPPPDKEQKKDDEMDINKRNMLSVMVSSDNRIMCQSEIVTLQELREKAKEFIDNPTNAEDKPEKEAVDIPLIGNQLVTSKHVISLQCDRGTKYQTYIDVQAELAAAYHDLRDVAAKKFFGGKTYNELEESQQEALRKLYPQTISEAEPKTYGDKKKK